MPQSTQHTRVHCSRCHVHTPNPHLPPPLPPSAKPRTSSVEVLSRGVARREANSPMELSYSRGCAPAPAGRDTRPAGHHVPFSHLLAYRDRVAACRGYSCGSNEGGSGPWWWAVCFAYRLPPPNPHPATHTPPIPSPPAARTCSNQCAGSVSKEWFRGCWNRMGANCMPSCTA